MKDLAMILIETKGDNFGVTPPNLCITLPSAIFSLLLEKIIAWMRKMRILSIGFSDTQILEKDRSYRQEILIYRPSKYYSNHLSKPIISLLYKSIVYDDYLKKKFNVPITWGNYV